MEADRGGLADGAVPAKPPSPLALVVGREQRGGRRRATSKAHVPVHEPNEHHGSLDEGDRSRLIGDRHGTHGEGERDLDARPSAGVRDDEGAVRALHSLVPASAGSAVIHPGTLTRTLSAPRRRSQPTDRPKLRASHRSRPRGSFGMRHRRCCVSIRGSGGRVPCQLQGALVTEITVHVDETHQCLVHRVLRRPHGAALRESTKESRRDCPDPAVAVLMLTALEAVEHCCHISGF